MLDGLAGIPDLKIIPHARLANYTRFGIGGACRALVDAGSAEAFVAALRAAGEPLTVIGGGTNLIVSDEGFPGTVLRFTARRILAAGNCISVEAGAVLDHLVDFANERGLRGLETLAGIPGWLGAAVYGNAGAYGHAISERVRNVRFYDGEAVRVFSNHECKFRYRESIFKTRKDWIVLSAELALDAADAAALTEASREIRETRNRKFPPSMKCAGSIFKNFLLAELPPGLAVPPEVVREGKVAAAYFLEQVGAKGARLGGIRVADYHANLIYNEGAGAAAELRALIGDLKSRVRARFGIEAEEEVQYVGFDRMP